MYWCLIGLSDQDNDQIYLKSTTNGAHETTSIKKISGNVVVKYITVITMTNVLLTRLQIWNFSIGASVNVILNAKEVDNDSLYVTNGNIYGMFH